MWIAPHDGQPEVKPQLSLTGYALIEPEFSIEHWIGIGNANVVT